jgi:hypothetical protein
MVLGVGGINSRRNKRKKTKMNTKLQYTIAALKLSTDNTRVVAEKRAGRPKYGVGCKIKSMCYYHYRQERRESGCHLSDGWEHVMSQEVDDAILPLHGFTRESAVLSARAFTAANYGGKTGSVLKHDLLVPTAGESVDDLAARYVASGYFVP